MHPLFFVLFCFDFIQCLPRHPVQSGELRIEFINSDSSLDINLKVHRLPLCLSFPICDHMTKTLLSILPGYLLSPKRWRCHDYFVLCCVLILSRDLEDSVWKRKTLGLLFGVHCLLTGERQVLSPTRKETAVVTDVGGADYSRAVCIQISQAVSVF